MDQPPPLWPADIVAHVFSFLYPSDQWSLRRVSSGWRSAIDLLQDAFYPFVVLQESHTTIIGTFCFSTQEVVFAATAEPLKVAVVQGKSRSVHVPNLASLTRSIAENISNVVPNHVTFELSEDKGEATIPFPSNDTTVATQPEYHLLRTRTYGICPGGARPSASSSAPFIFVFTDTNIPQTSLSDMKAILDNAWTADGARGSGTHIDVVPLPVERAPPPRARRSSTRKYKPGTVWIGAKDSFATSLHYFFSAKNPVPLQRWIHKTIMSTVSPSAPVDGWGNVENYNCYYGNGAVLLSHYDAIAAFGQSYICGRSGGFQNPFLSSHEDQPSIVPWSGLPPCTLVHELDSGQDATLVARLFARDVRNSVWLVRSDGSSSNQRHLAENASSTFVHRYPHAKLHLGQTLSGAEAVVAASEIQRVMMVYHYAGPSGSASARLYIADNTFFAEAYDEEFLLPTTFLKHVWSSAVVRDPKAEADAPVINGRPLAAPWILWGAEGTYSSPHVEPSNSCVWVHVFEGRKQWCVFNPRSQRWESIVQDAGSTLFMGQGIWHTVLNTAAATFAVAQNYIPVPPLAPKKS